MRRASTVTSTIKRLWTYNTFNGDLYKHVSSQGYDEICRKLFKNIDAGNLVSMHKPGFSKNSEDLLEDYAVEAS